MKSTMTQNMIGKLDTKSEIDAYFAGLSGWQRDMAMRVRELVHEADPDIREVWKWGTPVFSRAGNICAIGVFREHVKVNFFKGASLSDPKRLFNAGLEAKVSRAIDLRQGDQIDQEAFRALVREAVRA